jgi:hypothetical protein
MVLLRVPIRIETATRHAPFRNRAPIRGTATLRPAAAEMQTNAVRALQTAPPAQTIAIDIRAKFRTFHRLPNFFCWMLPGSFRLLPGSAE